MRIGIHHLNIGQRLLFAFGLMACLLVLVSAMGWRGLKQQNTDLADIGLQNTKVLHLERMYNALNEVAIGTRDTVLAQDPQEVERLASQVAQAFAKYQQAHDALYLMPTNASGQRLRQQLDQAFATARPLQEQVLGLARQGQDREAWGLLRQQAVPAMAQARQQIVDNQTLQQQLNAEKMAEADQAYVWAGRELGAGAALALVLTLWLSLATSRSIAQPLKAAQNAIEQIAAGHLRVNIRGTEGSDETALLLQAVAKMRDDLVQICVNITQSAQSVAQISDKMTAATHHLSQRTETESSAVIETTSAMRQLGDAAQRNADHVKQASGLASEASAVAAEGGQIVHQMVSTMKDINAASRKINEIVNVVDGMAFQTNLLALNAAVEAARAGEQGRGFAVVASEVRSLAQRSAEAAREIKHLITDNVNRVNQGSDLADRVGATMVGVVDAIQKVTGLMNDINHASTEQSAGVSEVGAALAQMEDTTLQNAQLVDDNAASADHLKQQAQQLLQVVSVFRP